jgi:predicted ABC-type ATPase
MSDPVLHLIAGPNGAGKSTLYERVIGPATHLEVNTDLTAKLTGEGVSFVAETVFSHESKLELVHDAVAAGYLVALHVVMVPEALAVARVANRVEAGGHTVPKDKIGQRYMRLWPLVAEAVGLVDSAVVYDNTRARRPFRIVARYEHGHVIGEPDWPAWTPKALRAGTS